MDKGQGQEWTGMDTMDGMDKNGLLNGQWTMDNGRWTMDNGQWTEIMSRPYRALPMVGSLTQGVALGWYVMPLQG